MDAIIELDGDFGVLMMNPSARRLFGVSTESISGTFASFLARKDFQRLTGLIRKLEHRPIGERNIWIPDGLLAVNSSGETIRTEATLSQLIADHSFCRYVLILRSVNERYIAEPQTLPTVCGLYGGSEAGMALYPPDP